MIAKMMKLVSKMNTQVRATHGLEKSTTHTLCAQRDKRQVGNCDSDLIKRIILLVHGSIACMSRMCDKLASTLCVGRSSGRTHCVLVHFWVTFISRRGREVCKNKNRKSKFVISFGESGFRKTIVRTLAAKHHGRAARLALKSLAKVQRCRPMVRHACMDGG